MITALAGTRPLLMTSMKHDGRNFAPWVAIATVLSASSVLIFPWIFPNAQDQAELSLAVGSNPAIGIIFGPAFDLTTADGFNAWRTLALGGFLTALGAIFAVTRATRGQEDSGQAELFASGVLGRGSRLLAGVGVAFIGSLLVGFVSGIVTVLFGGDFVASMLISSTFTATGWMFAGVAAITAQLGSDARTANSLAVGTLGALFILRGISYSLDAPTWILWANPLAWMTETKPASTDNWWPLLLALAFTLGTLAIAFVLQARRDFGQGIIPARPGPARGKVRSTWKLAARINTGPLITWTVAFIVLGLVFGFLTISLTDILNREPSVAAFLAAGATTPDALTSAFLVMLLSLVGIIAAIPGVQTMVKVRTEEMEDRVEPIMAASVPRSKFYLGHVVIALAAPAAFVSIAGLLIGTLASNSDIDVAFRDVLLQAVATIPAVWTITAVSVAVIGARPHVRLAAWVGVISAYGLTVLGPTFKFWDWVLAISPFWHVPNVTEANPDWLGLVWISLVTLVFLAVGFAGFRRRDLATT